MKTLSLTLLLLLLTATGFSQNRQRQNAPTPPPVEDRVETILEKLSSELSLSEEQMKSSEKVFTDYFSSIDELRASQGRPDRNKIESISKKRDDDFETLLTEDQKKKYEKIKEELFQRRRRPNQ
jgi:hypothetical protein